MDFIVTNSPPILPLNQKMWTENWTGWFLSFGGAVPYKPVEDIAFDVARFFQRGGTFQNYYMYHGGTNFGWTTGGPFIATSYDYDAPIDEYGLLRQPKCGHLKDVHKAIKLCKPAMVATGPTITSLGPNLENYGAFFDKWGAGVTSPMKLKGLNNGSTIDLSSQQWTYQTGLKGEELGLSGGGSSVWVSKPTLPKNQPLIWYKEIRQFESIKQWTSFLNLNIFHGGLYKMAL